MNEERGESCKEKTDDRVEETSAHVGLKDLVMILFEGMGMFSPNPAHPHRTDEFERCKNNETGNQGPPGQLQRNEKKKGHEQVDPWFIKKPTGFR